MLPKAKALEINFEALSEQMRARKKEPKRQGIPQDAEHAMVAEVNGKGDSPAARARIARSTPGKRSASALGGTRALHNARLDGRRARRRTKPAGRPKDSRSR